MKILRVFIKGPHIRWADLGPLPDNLPMAHWCKVIEQQGYIIGENAMVMRDSIESMALFDAGESGTVTPFVPRPVA